jgi:DNA-binding NarL/FixJ family response regulator
MSVLRLPVSRTVAVVSSDRSFLEELTGALVASDRYVVSGTDSACLETLEGWSADWRALDVEAIIIDLGSDISAGLDTLDAVRRRDPHAFVIVLSRTFGSLGMARIGANLVIEGSIRPKVVTDALTRRPRGRV